MTTVPAVHSNYNKNIGRKVSVVLVPLYLGEITPTEVGHIKMRCLYTKLSGSVKETKHLDSNARYHVTQGIIF